MFSHSAPWFTSEKREMKVAGRVLERHLVASGLTVYRVAYREHQKAYSKVLQDAPSKFYSSIISSSPSNSKQLFSTIHNLLKPQTQAHRETTERQCDDFMTFFRGKVDGIRSLFPVSPTPLLPLLQLLSHSLKPPSLSVFTPSRCERLSTSSGG